MEGRFEGLIPPVVRHPVFAIRRRPAEYSRSINTARRAFSPAKPIH